MWFDTKTNWQIKTELMKTNKAISEYENSEKLWMKIYGLIALPILKAYKHDLEEEIEERMFVRALENFVRELEDFVREIEDILEKRIGKQLEAQESEKR